jgi:multicomponent Na+:H+ antiporter subunit D
VSLHPALPLVLAALLAPLLPHRVRGVVSLLAPLVALALVVGLPLDSTAPWVVGGLELDWLRVDRLSRLFAGIFCVAGFICAVYALHLRDAAQTASLLAYAAAAVGGALAGDLVSLLVCWELAGLTSVLLIFTRRTSRSERAGMRYLLAQVASGMLLLGGIVLRERAGLGIAFDDIGLDSPGGALILLGFGLKAAFPVLHAWLQDTYPEATIVGTVVLSAFTTKLAIYALARGFAGTEILIWIGATMACFPIFYAVIENDLRRVLAYSLINQLGFMVVGIGIGGDMGVNGAAAHAVADILFKGLLFMSMGAVLLRAGTVNGSELGGLYKSMPQTAVLCMIGAASISAFPLFSGFVTKSMIMTAVAGEHRLVIWLMLLFASAGVFHHAGIKIPFFAFFAHDRGHRVAEAPLNMRLAMLTAAVLSMVIGCAPSVLYGLLPHPVDYAPYTTAHVINQLQLLVFSAIAFAVLMRTGIYPPELRSVNVDFDWFYRRALPAVAGSLVAMLAAARNTFEDVWRRAARPLLPQVVATLTPEGAIASSWSTSAMVWWTVVLLGVILIFAFVR